MQCCGIGFFFMAEGSMAKSDRPDPTSLFDLHGLDRVRHDTAGSPEVEQ